MSIQAYLSNLGEDIKVVFEHLIARIEVLEGKLESTWDVQPVTQIGTPASIGSVVGAGPIGLTDIDVVTGTAPVKS